MHNRPEKCGRYLYYEGQYFCTQCSMVMEKPDCLCGFKNFIGGILILLVVVVPMVLVTVKLLRQGLG